MTDPLFLHCGRKALQRGGQNPAHRVFRLVRNRLCMLENKEKLCRSV